MIEWILLVFYVVLAVQCGLEGKWWKSLYWVGAFILTLAVVKGLNK